MPNAPQLLSPVALSGVDNIDTTVFQPFFGTSAATPSVAAVIANMLQINPALTFAQIKQILQQTALSFGDPLVAGAGLVDALAAVTAAMPPPPNSPPAGTTADMVLSNPGGVYNIYNIGGNSILAGYQLAFVGTDWAFVTLGGFNDGETADMLMRNTTTGAFELYDISNNQITSAFSSGAVGLNWQVAGFGPLNGAGTSDMALVSNGAYLAYDIANNQVTGATLLGQVGPNWQVGGFAPDAPTGSAALMNNAAQLAQAMASFATPDAIDTSSAAPLGVDTSQQVNLLTPGHA